MNIPRRIALLNELNKRASAASKPTFSFDDFAFDAQKKLFRSTGARFRTAVCSRRSGKSVGIVGDMFDTCLSSPGVTCLYLTITHANVRSIIWRDIQEIKQKYKIDCDLNNLRMEVKFPNGSIISTGGVKDASVIETYRGWKIKKAYIDECQSMRPHVQELIKAVLIPALRDHRGSLYLTGTPGATKTGFFYEYSHNPKWFNCSWTAFENP